MITFQQFYLYAKIAGSIGTAGGFIYGGFTYLTAVFQQRKKISDTVELLATNHMPHLQASLDAHGESLRILSSDVRNIDTKVDSVEQRLDDTKAGVHALGESFLRHLENTSSETKPKKSRRK